MIHSTLRRALPVALIASLVALSGCSSNALSSSSPGCTLQFSGNVTGTEALGGCSVVARSPDAGDAAGYVLSLTPSSRVIGNLDVEVNLGPSPQPGAVSSEGVLDWSATGLAGDDAGVDAAADCTYRAGSDAVPAGSFSLNLTSIDVRGSTPHGTLSLTLYVHAPPATDCGPGDTETVVLAF